MKSIIRADTRAYGDVGDEVWIYDGEQIHRRSWGVYPEDPGADDEELEDDGEDPFHAPKIWIADFDSFMEPHFIYID